MNNMRKPGVSAIFQRNPVRENNEFSNEICSGICKSSGFVGGRDYAIAKALRELSEKVPFSGVRFSGEPSRSSGGFLKRKGSMTDGII